MPNHRPTRSRTSPVPRAGGITTNVPKTANRTKLASFPWYDTIDSLKRADLINPYTPVNVPYKADQVWMIYIAIVVSRCRATTCLGFSPPSLVRLDLCL